MNSKTAVYRNRFCFDIKHHAVINSKDWWNGGGVVETGQYLTKAGKKRDSVQIANKRKEGNKCTGPSINK